MLSRVLKQLLRRRINVGEIDIVVVLAVVLVVAAVAGIMNIASRFSN